MSRPTMEEIEVAISLGIEIEKWILRLLQGNFLGYFLKICKIIYDPSQTFSEQCEKVEALISTLNLPEELRPNFSTLELVLFIPMLTAR